MLGMMGNGNREKGAMMGRSDVMRAIAQELMGGPSPENPMPNAEVFQGQLKEHGAAVLRALQSGDVEAFTAGLQRFILAMEEMEEDDDPFDLEMG